MYIASVLWYTPCLSNQGNIKQNLMEHSDIKVNTSVEIRKMALISYKFRDCPPLWEVVICSVESVLSISYLKGENTKLSSEVLLAISAYNDSVKSDTASVKDL